MKNRDIRTVKRSVTLRKDVHEKLRNFLWHSEYKGMRCLRESTLICLILEWAFAQKDFTEKALLELYAEEKYARMPEKPRGFDWKKQLFDKEKR